MRISGFEPYSESLVDSKTTLKANLKKYIKVDDK